MEGREEKKGILFYFFPCFAAVAKMIFGDRNCFQERAVPFVEELNASAEWLQIKLGKREEL